MVENKRELTQTITCKCFKPILLEIIETAFKVESDYGTNEKIEIPLFL